MAARRYPFDARAAVASLRAADPALGRAIETFGPFAMKRQTMRTPFEALLRAIVYQQISGRAAGAIHARLLDLFEGGRPNPQALAAMSEERLRSAGLSRAKAAAARDLAAKTLARIVPGTRGLRQMPDDEIVARLVQVRGIGRWTVEMLLMSHLGRPDVLPATDLGVRRGFARLQGLEALPPPADLLAHGERWRPWRTVASWYLWRAADLTAGIPED